MSQTRRHDGGVMTFTSPAGGVISGVPILIGALVVVPIATVADGDRFAGEVTGVHELPTASGEQGNEGDAVFFIPATRRVTTVKQSGTIFCGHLAELKVSNVGNTAVVRLNAAGEGLVP